MVVVAIIGLLASIAIPKFANMIIKSKEAAVKGSLGAVRSAINIYYADNEGVYPGDLNVDLTTSSKYLQAIPSVSIPAVADQDNPGHPSSSLVQDAHRLCDSDLMVVDGFIAPGQVADGQCGWYYTGSSGVDCTSQFQIIGDPPPPPCTIPAGQVFVNCPHNDSKGVNWSSY